VKISLLKTVDKLVGIPAVRLLPAPKKRPSKPPTSALLIRPGGIGDAALLVPAIIALKSAFPDLAIDILAEKRNCAVFSLTGGITRVFRYDKPKEFLSAIRGSYSIVIDTEQWHRLSAVVARLIDASMTLGFSTNERKKSFTHAVPYSHDDYEVHSFLKLIAPITGEVMFDPNKPFLTIPESHQETTKLQLCHLGDKKIAAIFPGGSIREKRWGTDKFRETAKAFIHEGLGVVVLGGRNDIGSGNIITDGLPGILNLCGKLSLLETAAVLKKSDLLVTADSGLMHIAYGLGTRIVALFGPSNLKKWAPKGDRSITINNNVQCSPCSKFGYTPKCKINVLCMSAISIAEVFEASMSLLGNSKLTTIAF